MKKSLNYLYLCLKARPECQEESHGIAGKCKHGRLHIPFFNCFNPKQRGCITSCERTNRRARNEPE